MANVTQATDSRLTKDRSGDETRTEPRTDQQQTVRWQMDLTRDQEKRLVSLMAAFNLSSKKDLVGNALSILDWAKRQIEDGRIIASVDEKNEVYRELQMPIFDEVKPR